MPALSVPRTCRLWIALAGAVAIPVSTHAQNPPPDSREAELVAQQAEKAEHLHPYVPDRAEAFVTTAEEKFLGGRTKWHPFFDSAYAGGGLTGGAGYLMHLGGYSSLDVRGSITISGYKRLEAEFRAPRLFNRRGVLSIIGGWRQATQVGFYGIGTGNTSKDDRANYEFRQPYAGVTLNFSPVRRGFVLTGGLDASRWTEDSGGGTFPSVDEVYTSGTLPGLGASPAYLHTHGTVAFDWRDSTGYVKRGGYYGVTVHDYADTGDAYGFREIDYDAVQHIPILREAWVLSLHARAETTYTSDGETVPFFMMPSLGGGSSLRGFASWRFRDRNSLLLSADWRVLVNRFTDLALFYDAGKVTARPADLDLDHLKSDYGIGLRFHGAESTPLRIDIARSNEGLALVFAASAAF